MLRVNVGMSRKLSQDFNSTGYSVNLEGELSVSLDDPEAVIERIREYYDLAEEVLQDQISNPQSRNSTQVQHNVTQEPVPQRRIYASSKNPSEQESSSPPRNGNSGDASGQNGQQATNKQIQFLLALGKKQGLTKPKLESRVAEILGQKTGIYDLTKADAGHVLDQLIASNGTPAGSRQ